MILHKMKVGRNDSYQIEGEKSYTSGGSSNPNIRYRFLLDHGLCHPWFWIVSPI